MRMKVICGDPECREEFFVDSSEPIWKCPRCERTIINRNYPFLSAKLMQARIDGDEADWKVRLSEIAVEARTEISKRKGGGSVDLSFIDEALEELEKDLPNEEYRKLHDRILQKARELVLELERGS